ncbi:Fanconi anemia group B protein [Centroberyx gerrardi]|uniref:Fanconi anemia group B protein n=1 Tax=Centroberyx gerrardi TaxID=166262 RepID=UPI003AAC1038
MMERMHLEDWNQKPHRLSLCGRVILFQCKRASAPRESERNASELIFSSLSFKREDNTFLKANDDGVSIIISRKSSAHVDIVKCKCALDGQKRVNTPCILVAKSHKGESFKYSLLMLSSSNRLEPHMEFKLPYQMRESVSILQGPTVLWSHAGDVFYTSLQAGEVRQIPIQFSHSLIGELPLHKGQVFVLGLQNSSKEGLRDQSSGSVGSQTLGYFVENGQVFDGTMILPHPYSCITQCILVLSAEQVDGVLKSSVVAATSKRQLVYFENGILKEVCQLPFERPKDIRVVNTGRNGCLFTISFDQGHVCAIWKETFQIASHWSGVSSVHVDDFLGCGTDQLLLFFEDQGAAGQPLDNFLITDLCGTTYSSGQENGARKTSHPPQEKYLLTLQALESRLQSGLTMLQELHRDVRVKERVLLQSVQALTDVVSEREPVVTQYEQEGLIALWDGDDESKDEALDDKMQDMPAVCSKPQVDKLWHRIIEDRLVVGVMLTTDSSIPVDSVSLSILTETGQRSTPAVIQTQSQVFWLPTPGPSSPSSPSTLPEPAAKRSKRHNAGRPDDANPCRLAVTAVTRLTPLLNSGCVKCPVMLHYIQRQESSALVNNPTPVVLHCGPVPVDIQSKNHTQLLKNSKLKTDEVREDLLSLLAVLDRWVFHIDSPDYSLGDVDGWIQRTVGCERIEVSPQYLLFNSSGPSAPMLLHWHQTTPFQGELSVHSSQLQTLQFLDSLLGYLPASCSIQALRETGGRGAAQTFSRTLEKEVLSLKEGLSSLLCGEKEDGERRSSTGVRQQETPEPGSVEGLQRCREEWQRDLERSRMRLSPLVDVGRYRRLSQSLSKVQLEGDTAALLETQRTLFSSG